MASDKVESRYSIRAVERVCDILDLLQQSPDAASIGKVAQVANLPKSSAFRYLTALEARRYVQRNPATGNYQVGMALLPLRTQGLQVMRQQAIPHLERLRDQFGETINLGLLDGGRVFYLEIVESLRGVRLAASQGDRDPIHCTALGKAIASRLPVDQVRALLAAEGMPRRTPKTITSVEKYLKELDRVRELGYALDDGENEPDGRCVSVPLETNSLMAGISLSAPAPRFPLDRVPTIATALRATAAKLSFELEKSNAAGPRRSSRT